MPVVSHACVGSTWWHSYTEEQRTHMLVLSNLYFDSGRQYSPAERDSFGWCAGDPHHFGPLCWTDKKMRRDRRRDGAKCAEVK
jgi:hypothetical protein